MKERLKQAIRECLSNERNQEGVTLIELLAVIVILAVIAAIAVPVVLGSISRSKDSVTQQNMSVIVEALNRYATNHDGKYPSTNSKWIDITSNNYATSNNPLMSQDPNNNSQSYLKVIPNDGWGNHFYYYSDGNGFIIHTADNKSLTVNNTTNTLSPIPDANATASGTWWENASMASANGNNTNVAQ